MKSQARLCFIVVSGIFILLLLAVNFGGSGETIDKPEPLSLSGETMGTRYNVTIVTDSVLTDTEQQILSRGIDSLLTRINGQMSVYDDSSEISRFNRSTDTGWYPISIATSVVIAQALNVSGMTQGALDITVGPLVDLWGFGPAPAPDQLPSDEQIEKTLSKTGFDKLSVRRSPPAVKKQIPELRCDLGAVAKGYGVDAIGDFLRMRGYGNYLVEIGGEIAAEGLNRNGTAWQVGIQKPETDFGTVSTVSLSNFCMATSGDYQSFFERDGKRYSHLIDPRTGRPVTHQLASVTVIDEMCRSADALATALNVMGPDEGWELAVQSGLAAQFIVRDGDSFAVRSTPRFEEFLSK